MSGRAACSLDADAIAKACSLYTSISEKKFHAPRWIESEGRLTFARSSNVAPGDVIPVLVSGSHFPKYASIDEAVLLPMIWGIIPPSHKGSYSSHGFISHNCKLEGITESRLYGEPLRKGRRCVMVCDGFYVWKSTTPHSHHQKGSRKQPFFIYAPQKNGVKIEDESTWDKSWSEEEGWKGPKVTMIAGIFNCWISAEGEAIYSCAIISTESNESLSWCHKRMPAILETKKDVKEWLDYGNVGVKPALNLLQPVKCLSWHPVDTLINNCRINDSRCNKPCPLVKRSASSSLLMSWLKGKKGSSQDHVDGPQSKFMKI